MTTDRTPMPPLKRSRARSLVPLGILVWLGIEIWLMTLVGGVAGGVTVLLLLLGGVVLGALVIKRAGRRAYRNLTETIQRQQQHLRQHPGEALPPSEGGGTTGNGFLLLAGVLIMVPGFLSDLVGLLLLVPQVRAVLGRFAERSLERRIRAAVPGSLGDAFEQARMRQPDGKVVQGEVIRKDEPSSSGRADEGPRPPLAR